MECSGLDTPAIDFTKNQEQKYCAIGMWMDELNTSICIWQIEVRNQNSETQIEIKIKNK
jgi:hypothetical protein